MLHYRVCATVLCLAVGVWSGVAGAADHYVSNKAEAGAGTKENPFGMPDLDFIDGTRKRLGRPSPGSSTVSSSSAGPGIINL